MNDISQTLNAIKQLNRRPIAVHPINIDISGSVTAGLLLSQIFYWSEVTNFKEFYKTDADFCEETRLGLYELKGAKKKLEKLGLVSIVRKGIPAKTFYKLDLDVYLSLITSYGKNPQLGNLQQQVMGKTHNWCGEKPTTITETTTETTTDISLYNAHNAREKKLKPPKVSLEELSTDHIKDWLAEKRMSGFYIEHDENIILEKFKNYCLSKGKKYENYIAAYRNAFEWDSNKTTGNPKSSNQNQRNTDYNTAIKKGLVGTLKGQGGLTDLLT